MSQILDGKKNDYQWIKFIRSRTPLEIFDDYTYVEDDPEGTEKKMTKNMSRRDKSYNSDYIPCHYIIKLICAWPILKK